MSNSIEDIEGVGPAIGDKFREVQIQTTGDLLREAKTPAQRKSLAETSGIGESQILKFANHADLMRINGVGGQFAELLEASGVDTVKEFATRNAENLAEKMEEVNAEKNLTDRVPNSEMLQGWIDEAGKMEPGLEY